MAIVAETPVMEPVIESPALETEAQPEEVFEAPSHPAFTEAQYVQPSFVYAAPPVTYSAAPVTYMAAPMMMAPPAMVSHYTWNGVQYPSMEAAMVAMQVESLKPAQAPEADEPKEEPAETPEETSEVKKRSVKPVKKGCC